jgi:hypothetical protein
MKGGKCKNLEADISILIRGRNREVNELNNTIVSLENRLKSSESMSKSLRQSIMQINLGKATKSKQNELPPK